MDVSAHVKKMLESQKRTLQLEIKYGNPDDLNFDQALKTARETCEIDMLNTAAHRAIEIAAGSNSEHEFDRVFEENSQIDCSTSALQQYGLYKDFERYARDLMTKAASSQTTITQTTKVGNDIEMTTTNTVIDPITKGPLIRPVRNAVCNHIYGYQSVIESLAMNPRMRCPMIGCSNKAFVVPNQLVEI